MITPPFVTIILTDERQNSIGYIVNVFTYQIDFDNETQHFISFIYFYIRYNVKCLQYRKSTFLLNKKEPLRVLFVKCF